MRFEAHAPVEGFSLDDVLRHRSPERPRDRYPFAPSMAGLEEAAGRVRETKAPRASVVERLVAYNEEQQNPEGATLARKLLDPRSLVIVTGQQPSLLGGPLLVHAKVAGAVALSEALERAWKVPVVPLFWNHSEDHDLEEVNRFELLSGGEVSRRRAPIRDQGLSLDAIVVDEAVARFARDLLVTGGLGGGLAALLPRAEERWAAWCGRCVKALLPRQAFVLAEPFVLRPLVRDLIARTLEDPAVVGDAVARGSAAVRALGFEPQIDLRDPSPLFHVDQHGRRRRLLAAGGWRFDAELPDDRRGPELAAWLRERAATDPSAFSFHAVLRPIAQQRLLPILAHVNGPAENAYFAQLVEVFAALDAPLPAVVPRPRITLLRDREATTRAALGLEGARLLEPPEGWPPAPVDLAIEPLFAEVRHRLAAAAEPLRGATGDPGIERAVAAFAQRLENATKRVERSFARDRERRGEVGRQRRHRLAAWVRPRGRLQERILSPLVLLQGLDPRVLGDILARLDPFDFRHQVVALDAQEAWSRGDLA